MKNIWAIIGCMALAATLTVGCITTEHSDGSKDTSLLGFIPLSHTDVDGNTTLFSVGTSVPGFDWLSLGLKVVAGLGAGLAFPRTRENIVGAGKAIAHGDGADAIKHVGALTPFFHTPEDPPTEMAKLPAGFKAGG